MEGRVRGREMVREAERERGRVGPIGERGERGRYIDWER